eukprot:7259527-Alexandrium_andersonii.AAC.1
MSWVLKTSRLNSTASGEPAGAPACRNTGGNNNGKCVWKRHAGKANTSQEPSSANMVEIAN